MKLFQLPDDIFISIYRKIYAESLQSIKSMGKYYENLSKSVSIADIDSNRFPSDTKWKLVYYNSKFKTIKRNYKLSCNKIL
jgi:hypothetical protein